MNALIYLIAINVVKLFSFSCLLCFLLLPQQLKIRRDLKDLPKPNIDITLHVKNIVCKASSNVNITDASEEMNLPGGTNFSYELQNIAECRIEFKEFHTNMKDCICSNLLWIIAPIIVAMLSAVGTVIDLITLIFDQNRDYCDSQQAYCASIYQFFFCVTWISISILTTVFLTSKWGFWFHLPNNENSEAYFDVPVFYMTAHFLCYFCAIIFAIDGGVMIWIGEQVERKRRESERLRKLTNYKTPDLSTAVAKKVDETQTNKAEEIAKCL